MQAFAHKFHESNFQSMYLSLNIIIMYRVFAVRLQDFLHKAEEISTYMIPPITLKVENGLVCLIEGWEK